MTHFVTRRISPLCSWSPRNRHRKICFWRSETYLRTQHACLPRLSFLFWPHSSLLTALSVKSPCRRCSLSAAIIESSTKEEVLRIIKWGIWWWKIHFDSDLFWLLLWLSQWGMVGFPKLDKHLASISCSSLFYLHSFTLKISWKDHIRQVSYLVPDCSDDRKCILRSFGLVSNGL